MSKLLVIYNPKIEIMNRILARIKETGKSQSFISKKLNVSTNTMYNWCHNITQPSLLQANDLAKLLDCDISDLVDEVKDNTKETK